MQHDTEFGQPETPTCRSSLLMLEIHPEAQESWEREKRTAEKGHDPNSWIVLE